MAGDGLFLLAAYKTPTRKAALRCSLTRRNGAPSAMRTSAERAAQKKCFGANGRFSRMRRDFGASG